MTNYCNASAFAHNGKARSQLRIRSRGNSQIGLTVGLPQLTASIVMPLLLSLTGCATQDGGCPPSDYHEWKYTYPRAYLDTLPSWDREYEEMHLNQ